VATSQVRTPQWQDSLFSWLPTGLLPNAADGDCSRSPGSQVPEAQEGQVDRVPRELKFPEASVKPWWTGSLSSARQMTFHPQTQAVDKLLLSTPSHMPSSLSIKRADSLSSQHLELTRKAVPVVTSSLGEALSREQVTRASLCGQTGPQGPLCRPRVISENLGKHTGKGQPLIICKGLALAPGRTMCLPGPATHPYRGLILKGCLSNVALGHSVLIMPVCTVYVHVCACVCTCPEARDGTQDLVHARQAPCY
jgi:hypothetical protein